MALAVAAGALLYLSFPPRTVWWLAPLGFALLAAVLHGRRARAGFGYGVLAGLGFLVPLLRFTGEFVGLIGWVPLSLFEALFIGLTTAAISLVSTMRAWPLWAALLWVAGEALRSAVPFGGFPWGKIAFGQPEGLYLPLAAIGGTPLIGFAVALTGFGLTALVRAARTTPRATRTLLAPALATVLPLLAGVAAIPLVGTDANAGTVVVAAIQGNVPREGLDFNSQRRAVLDNHVARTMQLAEDVHHGRAPQPDLVIWPENSSDIDPYRNPDAWSRIDQAAKTIGAPISVGAVVVGDDHRPRNTAILWDPQRGPLQQYVKRQLQPFGETMPWRSFFRLFTPLVDRAGMFVPGTSPEVFTMGRAKVGIATCYEVAFDSVVRDSITDGAQLLAIPTNNATFGHTEMTYQQLAMSRERAVEHGRSVVVAATSGVSAIVAPDGTVTKRSGALFTPDALVETVPLRSTTTLATRLGGWPEWLMTAAGLLALASGITTRVRLRRAHRADTGAAAAADTTN
ncbi:apolipoprotein N-acyltransferase [Solihabitans fulvus]|uniref:Apolipoprotein N-acyltransferase n=2 Tax=Solihabitans fulvus TaxID=1892852 RepID=A0A5B2XRU6_9PSEU|nr:apolipoprotein N-acyltransferase [Solihabitans fulvus]